MGIDVWPAVKLVAGAGVRNTPRPRGRIPSSLSAPGRAGHVGAGTRIAIPRTRALRSGAFLGLGSREKVIHEPGPTWTAQRNQPAPAGAYRALGRVERSWARDILRGERSATTVTGTTMNDASSAPLQDPATEASWAHNEEAFPWGLVYCYVSFLALMLWRIF